MRKVIVIFSVSSIRQLTKIKKELYTTHKIFKRERLIFLLI